jgi:hypothetical protein
LVLPEDDANRRLAIGFTIKPSVRLERIQVLKEVGGWKEVLSRFEQVYTKDVKAKISSHLAARVFVLANPKS